ncbi:methyltransferase [Polaribacter pacificus]|uniref:Methyltransferase n=1 Tax=Polaribacter pacificus TaxID=1775173 RepID=A0A917HW51_9FLAO|nr:class I SAM-dependent methyltransferase [Polaribacter pacificus]GGG93390.1 methyltransferase [Polaribacter pacificus]
MTSTEELYNNLEPYLDCTDYSVSNEPFSLLINKEFNLLVTQPVPEQLSKYYESPAYISHSNTSKTIVDKIYQGVRKFTLQKKVKLINSFNSSTKLLLDVGCGTGDFLKQANENGWSVTGVEPNLGARNLASSKGISVFEDLTALENQQYDVISLWHVLEHVEQLDEYLNQIKKLLKEDGVLIIAVPNFNSYDAEYYKNFWAAYDVPRHVWHFSQQAISKLMKERAMSVFKILPMKFDSYYVSLLSEKYKNSKNNFIKAFYIGFVSNIKARKSSEYSSLIYLIKKDK